MRLFAIVNGSHKLSKLNGNQYLETSIDIELETSSKSQIESTSEEVEVKAEEKFSATEEFTNKISIAFLNDEETVKTAIDNSQPNKPKSK